MTLRTALLFGLAAVSLALADKPASDVEGLWTQLQGTPADQKIEEKMGIEGPFSHKRPPVEIPSLAPPTGQ